MLPNLNGPMARTPMGLIVPQQPIQVKPRRMHIYNKDLKE